MCSSLLPGTFARLVRSTPSVCGDPARANGFIRPETQHLSHHSSVRLNLTLAGARGAASLAHVALLVHKHTAPHNLPCGGSRREKASSSPAQGCCIRLRGVHACICYFDERCRHCSLKFLKEMRGARMVRALVLVAGGRLVLHLVVGRVVRVGDSRYVRRLYQLLLQSVEVYL